MAAGLGFKTFTTGEVLTAADTNGYLMQGVLVFASSAARAAAITSPQEGQYSYLKDTNSTEYYDGAAWIAAPIGDITGVTAGVGITGGGTSGTVTITNDMATTITASGDIVVGTGSGTYDNLPIGTTGQLLTADTTVSPYKIKWATPAAGSSGLTLIKRASYSNVASTGTTFDDVFTTTYKVYQIIVENHYAATSADFFAFNFRYGTTDSAFNNGNCLYAAIGANTAAQGTSSQAQLQANIASGDSTYPLVASMTVHNVGTGSGLRPQIYGQGFQNSDTRMFSFAGYADNAQNMTGFKIKSSASNVTGTISVYGLAI
jgi:hypothetical protein